MYFDLKMNSATGSVIVRIRQWLAGKVLYRIHCPTSVASLSLIHKKRKTLRTGAVAGTVTLVNHKKRIQRGALIRKRVAI